MGYSTAIPPVRISQGLLSQRSNQESTAAANGGSCWSYTSTNTLAAVRATGYFTDAERLGMRNGDIIFCSLRTGETSELQLFTAGVICEVSSSGAQLSSIGMVSSTFL